MPEQIPYIRVFISSPSDVNDERKVALEVIERLPYRPAFRDRVAFRIIAWDKIGADTPMRATLTPQEAINRGLPKPSECDIVIVLFWSRIGTAFTHTDGQEFLSGTHWELLDALNSEHAETIIYRRTEQKLFAPHDDVARKQYLTLDTFFNSELFYNNEQIQRGVNKYETPDNFREMFETHFEALVVDLLKKLENYSVTAQSEPDDNENIKIIQKENWLEGKSPFPGLRAFTEDDSDIFFGRGRETDALVKQVVISRFVAVIGASGSGKSSLVGAGLIPRLRANTIHGSKDWRVVRFVPGEKPFLSLAEALLRALPNTRLSDLLQSPDNIVSTIEQTLENEPEWIEVVLFIDQFEELFTLSQIEERRRFIILLTDIIQCKRLRTVVTMRGDFYHRAAEHQELAELLRNGSFPLAAPKRDALREMIEWPAQRAGLFIEDGLVGTILDDTGNEPGNLALMAYALDELYKISQNNEHNRLTFADYKTLEGVQGAIGVRAESVFAELGLDDNVLQRVFHKLIEVDERGTATRRRAVFQSDKFDRKVQKLINAFTDARLLTTNYDETKKKSTIEVAHEAILRQWERLAEWIEDTQDDLRLLRQVQNAAREWHESNRSDAFLWAEERLQPVFRMLHNLKPKLDPLTIEFVRPETHRLYQQFKVANEEFRQRSIIDRLAKIGKPAIQTLVKILSELRTTDNQLVMVDIHHVLSSHPSIVIQPLEDLLEHEASEVRLSALKILVTINAVAANKKIAGLLGDKDEAVKRAAALALVILVDSSLISTITHYFSIETNERQREILVTMLKNTDAGQTFTTIRLIEFLSNSNKNSEVWRFADYSLRAISNPKYTIPQLGLILQFGSDELVSRSIKMIEEKSALELEYILIDQYFARDGLREQLRDTMIKMNIIPGEAEIILRSLESKSSKNKLHILNRAAIIRDPIFILALIKIMNNDSSWQVRKRAAKILRTYRNLIANKAVDEYIKKTFS